LSRQFAITTLISCEITELLDSQSLYLCYRVCNQRGMWTGHCWKNVAYHSWDTPLL